MTRFWAGARMTCSWAAPAIDPVDGRGGNDILQGDAVGPDEGPGMDVLYGSDGDDSLFGGPEADTLYGDAGDDGLYGEEGTDSLVGDDGNDLLVAEPKPT